MQTSRAALPTGQSHIERFSLELRLQFVLCQSLTSGIQGSFDGLFGLIDGSAAQLFLFHRQGHHALHQCGDTTRLAKKLGLGILQIGRRAGSLKGGFGSINNDVQLVHKFS